MASTTVVCSPPLTAPSAMDAPAISARIQAQPEPALPKHNPKSGSLKSCKSFREIKQLQCRLTKQGQITHPPILTKLIAKYSEMGTSESLEHATKAFAIFKSKRENYNSTSMIYLYNCLIRGHSLAGNFNDSMLLYVNILTEDLEPDNYTFPFVLSSCAKSLKLFQGKQIHASIMKTGYCDDIFSSNSLINFYGECRETDSARKVFDKMPEKNVITWTSLICAYSANGFFRKAIFLFFEMADEGVEPNEVTMVSVISSCAEVGDRSLGEKVAGHVRTIELKTNGVLLNALVDMYMKCGEPEKAKHLFDENADGKNLVLYNTVMSNCVKMGKTKEAVNVFREMLKSGPRPDRVTMLSVITSSAELVDIHLGMQCHTYVLRNGLESWDNIGNSLIDMYTKCEKLVHAGRVFEGMPEKTVVSWNSLLAGFARNNDMGRARALFDQMPKRDIVSWNTMIGALVQQSLFTDAIDLFHCMQKEGVIIPDEATMVSVASACGHLGAHNLAKWAYNYIEKSKIRRNVRLNTSLVDMFSRCGDPQSAMRVFNEMAERDVLAWTAAIRAMAVEGNGERAVRLFHEILGLGIRPDPVVFSVVLTACSHSGLVEKGMDIFYRMDEHGVAPHVVHYGCVVDLLGRRHGLLDRALNFIREMPVEPNAEVWSAFLNACRVHKNEKMAALVSEMIEKSAGGKTGVQILLSNVYAEAGKWDDVAKVRMGMKEKGMKKIPGSSSVEINGAVHEFTSGDESHPKNERISLMLEEIHCRLKEEGYVPNLTNVVLHIDKQEKELSLSRHSEKLAIAYGLVSTGRGMPLRVIKNLRMCSDCHLFVKMVSKVYEREIVVRDNNRFHFFKGGSCSCRDYW